MRKLTKLTLLVLTILFMFVIIAGEFSVASCSMLVPGEHIARVQILEVNQIGKGLEETGFEQGIAEEIHAVFIDGPYKGNIVQIEHMRGYHPAYEIKPNVGEIYQVSVVEDEENYIVSLAIIDHYREPLLVILFAFVLLLLFVVCGKQGLRVAFSLIITIVSISLFLYLVLQGINPLLLAIFIGLILSFATFSIIAPKTSKSLAALGGTLCGIVAAGILAYTFGYFAYLSGFSEQGTESLLVLTEVRNLPPLDFQGMLFGGMILGALGAIMDLSMSIASSVEEVKQANPIIKFRELFQSGLRVGKDIVGTMINTLILAYISIFFPFLLLLIAQEISIVHIVNMQVVTVEIIRALAGTTGLLLCIPTTAYFASRLAGKNNITFKIFSYFKKQTQNSVKQQKPTISNK